MKLKEERGEFEQLKRFYVENSCEVAHSNFNYILKIDKGLIIACDEFYEICIELFLKYFVYIEESIKGIDPETYFKRYLLPSVLFYIVAPFPGYVCTSILQAAIPLAYFALRQILEAITIAVYMDTCPRYKNLDYERKAREARRLTFSDTLGYFERIDRGLAENLRRLYGLLSSYIHPFARKGLGGLVSLADRSLDEHGIPPTFATAFALSKYTGGKADETELARLKKTIYETARLVIELINVWLMYIARG
ncbi:hypothetical protein [Pyrodictium abyssi]|uniref:Uncharacterized protein n=1 Tax=Pyrodictium abyssi TaxID=54256 RepID=A0ABM8IVY8_9CREN|nr:hypothetical protein PABY_12960 [Pyrodictium abyssi]